MANDYLVYRAEQVLHTVQVLRLAIERRFAKDDVVDERLATLESEIQTLIHVAQITED